MSANLDRETRVSVDEGDAMERRLFRIMCWATLLLTLASVPVAQWRVTTGLALGGALALLNHHWLRASIRTAFSGATEGVRPKVSVARFILRYFVVVSLIVAASELEIISVVAALVGLSVFAFAALLEGFVQTFLTFVHREEN
jgi:hypothetical protein